MASFHHYFLFYGRFIRTLPSLHRKGVSVAGTPGVDRFGLRSNGSDSRSDWTHACDQEGTRLSRQPFRLPDPTLLFPRRAHSLERNLGRLRRSRGFSNHRRLWGTFHRGSNS